MLNFLPVRNAIRRRTLGTLPLESVAESVEIVQPAETEWCEHPAVFLPGQLDLATQGVPGHSTLEEEIQGCMPRKIVHDAVIKYTLRNAVVHNSGFDVPGYPFRINSEGKLFLDIDNKSNIDSAIYCNSNVSDIFFGHWLQDACTSAFLASPSDRIILDHHPEWGHAAPYIDAFELSPEAKRNIIVDRLTIFQDYGQGSNKRARYAEMRARLSRKLGTDEEGPAAVYFRRGSTGVSRIVANEDELVEKLSNIGFEVVDLAGSSLSFLYNKIKNAKIVISIDGSHLNHLYFFMRSGSKLLTLIPSDRFTSNQVGYALSSGLRYGLVVVSPGPAGYTVNIKDLLNTIDLLESGN